MAKVQNQSFGLNLTKISNIYIELYVIEGDEAQQTTLNYFYWSLTFIEPIKISAYSMAAEGSWLLLQSMFILYYCLFWNSWYWNKHDKTNWFILSYVYLTCSKLGC